MKNDNTITINNFTLISMIGKGTYAKVYLVRHNKDNSLYALKALKKKYILEKNQQTHIMTQKEILSSIEHPFLVKLKMSFQDETKLYFVLQYCPGGQLFTLLANKDKLTQQQAKFYAGQIILALEQLHKNKIIYRDLKPENIIIDKLGYIKLADFGLSKILQGANSLTSSICGTPQYLAPQIIRKSGHGLEVDWWCLGCLIHEMITGYPPFRNQNRNQLFESIIYKDVDISKFSPKLQDLFKKLFIKDPKKRLGHTSTQQIKKHPWFEKIIWQNLLQKKIKPPFIPVLNQDLGLNNFDDQFTKSSLQSMKDKSPVQLALNQNFKGFSYESDEEK